MNRKLSMAIGAALLGVNGAALAITDTETNASIPFNFANPGARSMGMGGAFLGLADDATAAYTNPAGLTQLVSPEISIEGRHTEFSIPYVNSGSAQANPFRGSGIRSADADSSRTNLSFLSFVYPWQNWSFAAYRDELLRYHADFRNDPNGVTIVTGLTNAQGSPINLVTFPVDAHANLRVIDYGFSAGWRASDNVSLGFGLSYYDFSIDTRITRLAFPNNSLGLPAGTPVNQQIQHGSDHDLGVNLGARLVLSEHWSAGLSYRRGPTFGYDASSTVLTGSAPQVVTNLHDVRFKVPDQFGAGLSWHPNDALVVNFDADYIQYSQLTHGIQSLFGNGTATVSSLSIPNGVELHLGGEYTFTQMTHPFSVRAGVWHDPRHSIEYQGDPGTDAGALSLATLFHGGKGAQNHAALGFGWAFDKFEIDAAADFADLTDTYSVSAVYHFK
jgi:long-subunit fatty acid transport protein